MIRKTIPILTAIAAAFPLAASAATNCDFPSAVCNLSGQSSWGEFGTTMMRTYISPVEFHNDADGSALRHYTDFNGLNMGYYYGATDSATAGRYYRAPLNLPNGAQLCYMGVYARDSGAVSDHLVASISTYEGGFQAINNLSGNIVPATGATFTDIASVIHSTAIGDQLIASNVGGSDAGGGSNCITINNDILRGGHQYAIKVYMPQSAEVSFKAIELGWSRQISPAPATATFSDVPTNNGFFQQIQALSASGVTVGCGGGKFCPDAAVTRGQMAAFLARALGL
jgi:hypothetical protein